MIVTIGDIEYTLTSAPTPTGQRTEKGAEYSAPATTADGHPATVYWMAEDGQDVDIHNPIHAEIE